MYKKILIFIFVLQNTIGFSQEEWPPAYQDRRFKESWHNNDKKQVDSLSRDWSDRIKNLSLSKNNKITASVGGQLRLRYMGTVHEEFQDKNSGLFTIRARLNGSIWLGNHFRVYGEGIYSNTTNDNYKRMGIGSPVDKGALLNLFAEGKFGSADKLGVMVWFGRRELQWGHERIISPGNWLTTRRSWDGGGFSILKNNYSLTAFVAKPLIVVPDGYSVRDKETLMWGFRFRNEELHYSTTAGFGTESWSQYTKLLIEPYFINTQRSNVIFYKGNNSDYRNTLGILISGPIKSTPLDFEFEGIYQTGTYGDLKINAYSLTAEIGYNFVGQFVNPHLWFGVDYSSGDNDTTDGWQNTFDPLYPQVSSWFGEHGMVDRKNLFALSANLDIEPLTNLFIRMTYWNFKRSVINDAVYNTSGGILRNPYNNLSLKLGNSVQMSAIYEPSFHWQFTFTYNYWNPGEYFHQTQNNVAFSQHFFMITSQFTF